MEATWDVDKLIGFLSSWSAVRKLVEAQGEAAFEAQVKELEGLWRQSLREKIIRWPLHFRIGRISH
jgi:hypothetical protein